MSYHVDIVRTHGVVTVPIDLAEAQRALTDAGWKFDEINSCFNFLHSDGETSTLWFKAGKLWAGAPSERALQQMIDFAPALGARVRGDEFETCRTVNDWYAHPDDNSLLKPKSVSAQARINFRVRREWKMRVLLASVVALLAWAVSRLSTQ